MTTHNFSDDLPESLEERFKHKPGPLMEQSRMIAQAIYANRLEIDQLAGEYGQTEQDGAAEKYEWCRLCALVIEEEWRHGDVGGIMDAKALVEREGESLIGKRVWTYPMGDYPGGLAKVVIIYPDCNAIEIVMTVEHPKTGKVDVFGYEQLILIDKE